MAPVQVAPVVDQLIDAWRHLAHMSPVSLWLTQAKIPHCSHIGPLAPALPGPAVSRKKSGVSPEDSDQLLGDEGVVHASSTDRR